eukprot:CAMPEP_0113986248 /NCGR_PEP_ID=MMETSP0328-20130328/6361_1 /TAXON_ID=39455 /ORGANISM="Alexandrium minutum" /LENGTH=45 /assembly_acc=CAM_ASM_000350
MAGNAAPIWRANFSPFGVHMPALAPHWANDGKARAEKLSCCVYLL